jgi:biopolymer transport protein ExbB
MHSGTSINWLSMIHLDLSTVVLAIFSVLSVAVMIERGIRYRNADIDTPEFMDRIREFLRAGKLREALQLAEQTPGPVAAVVKAGIISHGRSRDEIRDAIDRVRVRQTAFLEKNIPLLGTVGSTAPFVGLFGTVIGIMTAFHNIAMSGGAGAEVVSEGISQALIATAGGLLVAIVAVIAYNFFTNWSGHFVVEMDTAANELVHLLTDAPAANAQR